MLTAVCVCCLKVYDVSVASSPTLVATLDSNAFGTLDCGCYDSASSVWIASPIDTRITLLHFYLLVATM